MRYPEPGVTRVERYDAVVGVRWRETFLTKPRAHAPRGLMLTNRTSADVF